MGAGGIDFGGFLVGAHRGDSKGGGTNRARNYDRVQPDFMHKTSVELEERLLKRISDLILFNINEVDDRNVSLKKKKKKKKNECRDEK